MATTYPGTIQTFTDPSGTSPLATGPDHAQLHTNINDTLEAVQTVMGTTAGTAVLKNLTAGQFVVSESGTATLTNKTLTSPKINEDVVLTANSTTLNNLANKNYLINGNFDVSQRATTFVAGANNDDVYTLDRWNLISDGNDVLDVSQETVTDLVGSNYAIKLDVETAKRGGIVQILEQKNTALLRGQTVSLSFKVKSANISALRAVVLTWAGTADTVTSDVVGTWAATPTWAANWTAENTPADLTVTSGWTTVKIEGIAIDSATVNNLAVAIWTPNEETIGDIVYISQAKLEIGSVSTPFVPLSFEEELRACQRYYEKSYNYGTVPGTDITTTDWGLVGFNTGSATSNQKLLSFHFKVTKRINPTTLSIYDRAGNASKVSAIAAAGGYTDNTAYTGSLTSETGGYIYISATTIGGFAFAWAASSEL